MKIQNRYEAIEIDGRWYVIDHKNPADLPDEQPNQREAEINARLWSILVRP